MYATADLSLVCTNTCGCITHSAVGFCMLYRALPRDLCLQGPKSLAKAFLEFLTNRSYYSLFCNIKFNKSLKYSRTNSQALRVKDKDK